MLLSAAQVVAQSDTARTITLKEIRVLAAASDYRLRSVGQAVHQSDTSLRALLNDVRIADQLRFEGLANIRSYGAALLATIGLRGGTSNQTAVIWNGFRLPTPLSGVIDGSLMPASFFDAVSIVPGGQGALWGSSAVGGIVALSTKPQPQSMRVQLHAGSFGQFGGNAALQIEKKKWHYGLRTAARSGRFDYPYTVPGTQVRQRLTHASARFLDLMPTLHYSLNRHWQLNYAGWFNRAHRQLPPLINQTVSQAEQFDYGSRNTLQAHYHAEHWNADLRAGVFDETIVFNDSLNRIFSNVHFISYATEAEARYQLKSGHIMHAGLSQNYATGSAPGYTRAVQHRASGFLSHQYTRKKAAVQADLRIANRLVPGMSLAYWPTPTLKLRSRIGLTWRQPVINELYWKPGGNLHLKDETGWNSELGADATIRNLKISATIYQRKTRNQILWSPRPGSGFWSPDNLGLVETRGLETRAQWSRRIGKVQAAALLAIEMIDARNRVAISVPAIAEGARLWFVPRRQANGRVQMQGKHWLAYINGQYISTVHTPQGILPSAQLYGLGGQWQLPLVKHQIWLQTRIENLTNQTWISIDRRPMPGRAWHTGVSWHIAQAKHSK